MAELQRLDNQQLASSGVEACPYLFAFLVLLSSIWTL